MSDSEDEESPPKPRRPIRRAPRGGDPHVQEQKLSVLSGAPKHPKWSFGKATRFKQAESLSKSQSSPAFSSGVLAESGHASDGGSPVVSRSIDGTAQVQPVWGDVMDATFSLSSQQKVPYMKGGLDRAIDNRQRHSQLKAKQYQPGETIGEATAKTYTHAPRYTFGGGKSRMSDQDRKQEDLLKLAHASAQEKIKKLANTEPATRRNKVQLANRGFGSEARLRHRSGAFDLPVSPGPAAYEVARDSDAVPEWSPSALCPWGNRTAPRPDLRNPTATDVAPGEHTAHHTMQAYKPSPTFGHLLRKATKDNFPDPGIYGCPSYVSDGPSFSVGPGPRTKWSTSISPGHVYDPNHDSVEPHNFATNFGSMERAHPADEVDPDEPPGPGAHKVQKDWSSYGKASDARSAGFGVGQKLKTFPGLGQRGLPGPGAHSPQKDKGKSMAIHRCLPRPIEKKPGPADYSPDDQVNREAAPAWAPMHHTDPRRSPFVQASSGNESAAEAMLRRCAAEVARANEERGIGGQREDKIAFVPRGPKFSLGARRRLNAPGTADDCEACVGGPISSIG